MRASSPQKRSRQVVEISKARTISKICRCFRSTLPFYYKVPGQELYITMPFWERKVRRSVALYSMALSVQKILIVREN